MKNNFESNWFVDWFNSPYYHILYSNRDHKEAELFIDNLISLLNPPTDTNFLDLGCGKGRHSIYLNAKTYTVTGIDLSEESIAYAKQFESDSLHFQVHDMRKIFQENKFDFILNLFTSFGYFENEEDNFDAIHAVYKALKPNGIFVLDFLNVEKVIPCILAHETKSLNGIEFNIEKKIENNFIIKDIRFNDKGNSYHFQECVKAITLDTFKKYFSNNNLKIVDLRGNYNLDTFDTKHSDRLILIAQKTEK